MKEQGQKWVVNSDGCQR